MRDLLEFPAGVWKRKRIISCGSGNTLKKEAGSELGSMTLQEELEAEAKHFKNEEAEANSEARHFKKSRKRKHKIFDRFHILEFESMR